MTSDLFVSCRQIPGGVSHGWIKTCWMRDLCVVVVFLAIVDGRLGWSQDAMTPPPLSSIRGLMASDHQTLQMRPRVRIRGVVSSVGEGIAITQHPTPAAAHFCVQDSGVGIWIRTAAAIQQNQLSAEEPTLPRLEVGVEVQVTGILEEGGYAPAILPQGIEILGRRTLPPTPWTRMQHFFSGKDDVRRVNVDGVVQMVTDEDAFNWLVRVQTGVGHFMTRLPKEDRYAPANLLDAKVRCIGLAAVSRNLRREMVCPRVIINSHDDFRVIRPAPVDPFEVPVVPPSRLDGYDPGGRPLHRRCIRGTVTYYDDRLNLFLQEGDVGIRVKLNDPADIRVGQRVEVSGFIDTSLYLSGLRGAVARPVGGDPMMGGGRVKPLELQTLGQIPRDRQGLFDGPLHRSRCDGRLVKISGRLLSFDIANGLGPDRLQLDSGGEHLTAILPAGALQLPVGSELMLTGVADVHFSAAEQLVNFAPPDRMDLLLRSHGDIEIISRPSWWTAARTFTALMIVTGLGIVAIAWALTVRRTLAKRTRQLAGEMAIRRNAAVEFQATLRERTQLAANLHDTVLQTMAGIAYQIEACDAAGSSAPAERSEQLATARRMVQRGQDDLRDVVWTLHYLPLQEGTFCSSVERITQKIQRGRDTAIEVRGPQDFPTLADFVAGNLLLVIQEAVRNAIKHSACSRIDVTLSIPAESKTVRVEILDNGGGFDVNGRAAGGDRHFGIDAMRHRVERLGGRFEIEVVAGAATRVIAQVPVRDFDRQIA